MPQNLSNAAMFASALRLLSSPPSVAHGFLSAVPPVFGNINSPKGSLALSAAARLVALRHAFHRRLGVVSMRRGVLGVKHHNARSVQHSYTHSGHCAALRSSLRRKASPRRGAGWALRVAAVCSHIARLRDNTHHPPFLQRFPPHSPKAVSSWSALRSALAESSARTATHHVASAATGCANSVSRTMPLRSVFTAVHIE